MCPYVWDKKFVVLCSSITLDKVNLFCADKFRTKPTGNDAGFITHSSTIYYYGLCLDSCVYLINEWIKRVLKYAFSCFENLVITNKFTKVEEISERYEILTFRWK